MEGSPFLFPSYPLPFPLGLPRLSFPLFSSLFPLSPFPFSRALIACLLLPDLAGSLRRGAGACRPGRAEEDLGDQEKLPDVPGVIGPVLDEGCRGAIGARAEHGKSETARRSWGFMMT